MKFAGNFISLFLIGLFLNKRAHTMKATVWLMTATKISLCHVNELLTRSQTLSFSHTQTQSAPYQWEGERSPFTSCINYEWQAKGHRGRRGHSYGQNIDPILLPLLRFHSPPSFPDLSLCLVPPLDPSLVSPPPLLLVSLVLAPLSFLLLTRLFFSHLSIFCSLVNIWICLSPFLFSVSLFQISIYLMWFFCLFLLCFRFLLFFFSTQKHQTL